MRTLCLLFLTFVSWTVVVSPLSALDCRIADRPAATLFFPYFEVDLASPSGMTTLISIANADDQPTLAHVVLWTDCGFPALSFSLYLPGNLSSLSTCGRSSVPGSFR